MTPEEEASLTALLKLEEREFPLLIWVGYRVQREYFDRARFDPPAQLRSALTDLGLHRPEFFAEPAGEGDGAVVVTVGNQRREFDISGVSTVRDAAERLEPILVFARDALGLQANTDELREFEYAAINGLLAPLDPHTILLDPKENADLGIKTRGQFGGVGIEIVSENRRIAVKRVLPGAPAYKAGLKAGDVILEIDEQSTVNMSGVDARELLRGPVDTVVKVKLKRGDEVITATITRAIIRVESVTANMLPGRVGYLKISTFQANTGEQAKAAIEGMLPRGAPEAGAKGEKAKGPLAGLIIDVRGNTGGLLTQAVEVIDHLVGSGEIVIVRSAQGREAQTAREALLLPPEVSVVVLVDERSASAAEIVSGAVKHLGRGVVLGRSSFGKGTVQLLVPRQLYGQEQALKLTVAEYFVAGDAPVQTAGVQPDLSLLPVQLTNLPGITQYYDLERFERARERAQVAHLPSAKHERPHDKHAALRDDRVLRYFLDPRSKAGRKAQGADGERLALLDDPEIRTAHAVAEALAGAADRDERMKRLRTLRGTLAADEDAAITEGLATVGVDWRGAPDVHGSPELTVRASIEREGAGPGQDASVVPAGTPFVLHIELANRGSKPAERVHVSTDCEQDELDGIELLLGRVEPGQIVTRDLRLQVMSWHPDFTDTLTVAAHGAEPDETPDAEATVRFNIQGRTRPRLSYDYWIIDDPALAQAKGAPKRPPARPIPGEKPFTVKGNGDGVLQPGERVLVAVRVQNHGPGDATDVRALVRNRSGTQALLEEGFVYLGPLKAGAAPISGAFGVTVNPKAVVEKPVELELTVADVESRESVQHEIDLRVVGKRPAFEALPKRGSRATVGDESVRLYNAADSSAAIVTELAPGGTLTVTGAAGKWLAVPIAGASARRLWVPRGLVTLEDKPASKTSPVPPGVSLVMPPVVELSAPAGVVKDAEVEIRGVVTHERRVHDVVVSVRPSGPAEVEKKVHYVANPTRGRDGDGDGDSARRLEFVARVPLAPGSNAIFVTARDGRDVEATRELRVFRE